MSHFGLGLISGFGVPGNDSFTKILMHFEGANGSTTFTDSNAGGSAHTWSTSGSCALSTSSPKLGVSNLHVSTVGITTPNISEFNLGTSDWTVECWLNFNGVSGGGFKGICGQTRASASISQTGLYVYRDNSNKILAGAYSGTNTWTVTSSSTFATSNWFHFAFVRSGNNLLLFINGTQEGGTLAISGAINYDSGATFGVGCVGSSVPGGYNQDVDEFRLSVGIARWTSNFTPPNAPYV